MNPIRTVFIASVALALLGTASGRSAAQEVVCVEGVRAGGLVPLTKLIASHGYTVRNPIDEIADFRPRSRSVLVLASGVTADRRVGAFLKSQRGNVQHFVRQGGCVLVFAQRDREAIGEEWLIPGMQLLRGGGAADRLDYVDRQHPLFSTPCAISHRRLNRSWTDSALSAECFRLVSRGRIVAARESDGRNAWCVEFGWGQGRVVFFACEPERAARGSGDGARTARDLVENALAYAGQVVRGQAERLPDHAVVVEGSSGYKPRSWTDSKKSDFAFEAEVNASVDRGIAFLLNGQRENGRWGRAGRFEVGTTALGVVALLGTGVSKHKDSIKEAVAFIVENRSTAALDDLITYEVGLVMMALDAFGAPMYERFRLEKLPPEKREAFEFERALSDNERQVMARCVDWLVRLQLESGYWSYSAAKSRGYGDLSNTQFAILGLRSAARCAVAVPAETWVNAIDALLRSQATTGEKVNVPEIKSPGARTDRPSFYVFQAKARPWSYLCDASLLNRMGAINGQTGVSGSRTSMGISSLLISHEGLALISKAKAGRTEARVHKAVRDGIGWLWVNWSVTENPGMGEKHHYYYLYALERVGMLAGKRFLGDRDWYREGAAYLLGTQLESGAWGDGVIDTCFALLFLKRSTPPPVITPGG